MSWSHKYRHRLPLQDFVYVCSVARTTDGPAMAMTPGVEVWQHAGGCATANGSGQRLSEVA